MRCADGRAAGIDVAQLTSLTIAILCYILYYAMLYTMLCYATGIDVAQLTSLTMQVPANSR